MSHYAVLVCTAECTFSLSCKYINRYVISTFFFEAIKHSTSSKFICQVIAATPFFISLNIAHCTNLSYCFFLKEERNKKRSRHSKVYGLSILYYSRKDYCLSQISKVHNTKKIIRNVLWRTSLLKHTCQFWGFQYKSDFIKAPSNSKNLIEGGKYSTKNSLAYQCQKRLQIENA